MFFITEILEKGTKAGGTRNPKTTFSHHRGHREKTFLPSLCTPCSPWFTRSPGPRLPVFTPLKEGTVLSDRLSEVRY
jgi:hypothetical protein